MGYGEKPRSVFLIQKDLVAKLALRNPQASRIEGSCSRLNCLWGK